MRYYFEGSRVRIEAASLRSLWADHLRGRRGQGTVQSGLVDDSVHICAIDDLTVFFFAKSPEAPRTTMTVLSRSSMLL